MLNENSTIRIQVDEMENCFNKILCKSGLQPTHASICARIFVSNTVDGVHSHGVNRFYRFIENVREGNVHGSSHAVLKNSIGNLQQWDGQSGPGPVNAMICTDEAMKLAAEHGIGCIALANTNHWLRGGTYGWHAARNGFVFICWSNTIANMPAWGAINPVLGNNPLVIAVPFKDEAIVLDMAMSQYSYGALELYHLRNEKLPVPGGYDHEGRLSIDPNAIQQSKRTLPVGYWKGAGLSLLLDIVATILSGGLSTSEITKLKSEANLSQLFIAIELKRLANYKMIAFAIDQILEDFHSSVPEDPKRKVRYPGENVARVREENAKHGVPVLRTVWEKILTLEKI